MSRRQAMTLSSIFSAAAEIHSEISLLVCGITVSIDRSLELCASFLASACLPRNTATMFEGNRVVAHTRSRYPIFQSPMTWIARSPLVTAVSKAGAMGLLENSIRDLAVTKKEFTAIPPPPNGPFGGTLPIRYLQMDPKEETAIIDWLLGQGIHFVTTS